jgi:hypothetical protein
LRLSGFEPIEARSEFEGQYMWIVSRAVSNDKIAICPNNRSANIKELCRKFVTDREYEIRTVARSLRLLKQQNYTVYIWGAGAKGTTFVNLFDEEKQFVLALVDINPEKQNKFVGKTAHKVICPQKMQDILINDNGGG